MPDQDIPPYKIEKYSKDCELADLRRLMNSLPSKKGRIEG